MIFLPGTFPSNPPEKGNLTDTLYLKPGNFHLQNEKYLVKSIYVYPEKNRNTLAVKPGTG
jgi:hypothetical protein